MHRKHSYLKYSALIIILLSSCSHKSTDQADCNNNRIYFYSDLTGNGDIYTYDLLQQTASIVVDHDSTDDAPRFNQFRNELVFRSFRDGVAKLYTINEKTGKVKYIMDNPAGDEVPDWSPIRNEIVYSSPPAGSLYYLIVNDLDRKIKDTLLSSSSDFFPSWSPDGTEMIIEYTNESGDNDIAVIERDGTNFRFLTQQDGYYGHPSFSGTGQRVLYYKYESGQADIYSADSRGIDLIKLTDTPVNELIARYSHDDSRIIIGGIRNDNWEVLLSNGSDTPMQQLTDNSAFDGDPVWVKCAASKDH